MDTTPTDIKHLFEQLGLAEEDSAIDAFIADHVIPADTRIDSAEFWNDSQRTFLREALARDNNWTVLIDQLDARLRQS